MSSKMKTIFSVIALLVFSADSSADETRCFFGDNEKVAVDYINISGGTAIDIIFPKVKKTKFKSLRLWYGKEKELFLELPFIKVKDGYLAEVTVGHKHKPIKLSAIYHYQVCYAEIEATIESGAVRQVPNS